MNSRGISILQVLIASGMLSSLAIYQMKLLKLGESGQKRLDYKVSESFFRSQLHEIITHKAYCDGAFKRENGTGPARYPSASNNTRLYEIQKNTGGFTKLVGRIGTEISPGVTLENLELTYQLDAGGGDMVVPNTPSAGQTTHHVNLVYTLSYHGDIVGGKRQSNFRNPIIFAIVTDSNDNIIECYSPSQNNLEIVTDGYSGTKNVIPPAGFNRSDCKIHQSVENSGWGGQSHHSGDLLNIDVYPNSFRLSCYHRDGGSIGDATCKYIMVCKK